MKPMCLTFLSSPNKLLANLLLFKPMATIYHQIIVLNKLEQISFLYLHMSQQFVWNRIDALTFTNIEFLTYFEIV
jgi:hypothetical protein